MATLKKNPVLQEVTPGRSIAEARAQAALLKDPTLRELHAEGNFPLNESVLVELGVEMDEFLETFGNYTHDHYLRAFRSNSLDTSQDKVFTNPNLVQGASTIVGPPGSVQMAQSVFEKAEKSRQLMDRMNSRAGISIETPAWQKAAVAVAEVPVVSKDAVPVPLPVSQSTPTPEQVPAADRTQELIDWCSSGKKSKERLATKSYMLEAEIVELIALISEEMSSSMPVDVNPSSVVRAALRIGLVEQRKKLKGGA